MRRVRKFLTLPAARRRLFLRSWGALAKWRAKLWIVPFRFWRDRLQRECGARRSELDAADPLDDVVWAVNSACRYIPKATCLVRALAARDVLEHSGLAAEVRIGVARDERGNVEAHAWLERQGLVVLGATDDANRFVPLPLPARRRQ